jgi:hypothetical protein
MDDKQLVQAFINYVNAEEDAAKEFREHERWHTDLCNCQRCKNLELWYLDMTWKQRLKAKWLFFKKYMNN